MQQEYNLNYKAATPTAKMRGTVRSSRANIVLKNAKKQPH